MKNSILITAYGSLVTIAIFLSSCIKDPIIPGGGDLVLTDSTWVSDSTWTNPNDSTGTIPGGGVGTIDSTSTNPNDTLGGGN